MQPTNRDFKQSALSVIAIEQQAIADLSQYIVKAFIDAANV